MRNFDKSVVFFWLVFCLSGCEKPVQDSGSKTEKEQQRVSTPVAEVVPPQTNFDASVRSLPNNFDFYSDDAGKVFSSVIGFNTSKDKFESDKKYQERTVSLKDSVLFDKVVLSGAFAFRVPTGAFQMNYDANKEQFLYEVNTHQLGGEYNGIELRRDDLFLQIKAMKGLSYINSTLKVAPHLAKELDGHLGLVLVGKVVPPYARLEKVYDLKTYEATREVKYWTYRILNFSLDGAWMFDTRTGEILSKKWSYRKAA